MLSIDFWVAMARRWGCGCVCACAERGCVIMLCKHFATILIPPYWSSACTKRASSFGAEMHSAVHCTGALQEWLTHTHIVSLSTGRLQKWFAHSPVIGLLQERAQREEKWEEVWIKVGQARSGPNCSGAAGRMPERGCAAAGRSCAVCWCCPCCWWGSARPASRSGPWPSAERETSTRRSRVMRPRCGAGCVYVSLYIVFTPV